jgi:hypothetical protein
LAALVARALATVAVSAVRETVAACASGEAWLQTSTEKSGAVSFGSGADAFVRVYWPCEPPCSEDEDCDDLLHSSRAARFCLGQTLTRGSKKKAKIELIASNCFTKKAPKLNESHKLDAIWLLKAYALHKGACQRSGRAGTENIMSNEQPVVDLSARATEAGRIDED